MSKYYLNALTKFGLLSVVIFVTASSSVRAQSLHYKLRANIPFDFTVIDKNLPAGEYEVGRAVPSSGDLVLSIRNAAGMSELPFTNPVQAFEPARTGKLVFHRYGDHYFLVQVWPAGATTGRAIPKSRQELEIERHGLARTVRDGSNSVEIVSVAVASN